MFILGCVFCNSKLRGSFDNIFLSFSMKVARGNAEGNQGSQPLMGTLEIKESLALHIAGNQTLIKLSVSYSSLLCHLPNFYHLCGS